MFFPHRTRAGTMVDAFNANFSLDGLGIDLGRCVALLAFAPFKAQARASFLVQEQGSAVT